MTSTTYVSWNDVQNDPLLRQIVARTFPSYNGRNDLALRTAIEVTIQQNWDGGSRTLTTFYKLSTGEQFHPPTEQCAPWSIEGQPHRVVLTPDVIAAEDSVFCGKRAGIAIILHPDAAAKLLPAPVADLTNAEIVVLWYATCRKASYAGRNRQQMARDDGARVSDVEWEEARASLIARGFLNRAGAVQASGRNANNEHKAWFRELVPQAS